MSLFSSRRGDGKAEWRVAYDLATAIKPGDTLTHEDLCEALERDPEDRKPVYRAVARANKELQRKHSRTLGVVAGVGYRMLHASEHEMQADRYRTQSARKMHQGLQVLRATNLSELDEPRRKRTLAATMVLEGLVSSIEGVQQRQQQMESALQTVVRRVEALEHRQDE